MSTETAQDLSAASETKPRLLVVDDEEAILETMTFTFMDDYEVITSNDARRALDLLEEKAPVAVVITDQRMPEMTGSQFLSKVYEKHPETTRIVLTGFADMESTVEAINAGHVWAYVNKPWEPDELKQVVRRAAEHHALTMENRRLLDDLQASNRFLASAIDRLRTGALVVDSSGVLRAANAPARDYLGLPEKARGTTLDEIFEGEERQAIAETVKRLADEGGGRFEDAELRVNGGATRLRISLETLTDDNEEAIGRVILFKEVSHEPLRRRFEETVIEIGQHEGPLRSRLEDSLLQFKTVADDVRATGISSPGMGELAESVSRAQTAVQNWLDVDDLLAREDYPDAQALIDRIRVATQRWPTGEKLPERVASLAQRVENYYESGENAKERVL